MVKIHFEVRHSAVLRNHVKLKRVGLVDFVLSVKKELQNLKIYVYNSIKKRGRTFCDFIAFAIQKRKHYIQLDECKCYFFYQHHISIIL